MWECKLWFIDGCEVGIEDILNLASASGNVGLMKILIKLGVNINHVNEDGYTPLMMASENGHLEAIKELLSQGSDPDIMDNNGITALMRASTR